MTRSSFLLLRTFANPPSPIMYNKLSPNNTFQTATQHKKGSTHHMKTTISRTAGPTLYTLEPHPIKNYRAIYSLKSLYKGALLDYISAEKNTQAANDERVEITSLPEMR